MESYQIICLIAAVLSSAILGTFVLWKRVVYFGDCLSHAGLFAISICVAASTDSKIALIVFSILIGVLFEFISKISGFLGLSKNTSIAVISYSFLSYALLISGQNAGHKLESYIFGDISISTKPDAFILTTLCLCVVFYSIIFFRKILLSDVSEDFARVAGVKVRTINIIFFALLSASIALSISIIGAFLVTSLLIFPSSIARMISKSASEMMIKSAVIGITTALISVVAYQHLKFDLSPLVVAILSVEFFAIIIIKYLIRK